MNLIHPTIHMNGDRASVLLDNHTDAMHSLSEAIDKLPEVNGRNYYPQGDDALTAAIAQRDRWALTLADVRDEIETIAEKIAERV
jgi:hypothetical protein